MYVVVIERKKQTLKKKKVLKLKYIVYFCHYLQMWYILGKKKTLDIIAVDITNAFDYRIHDLKQKNSEP